MPGALQKKVRFGSRVEHSEEFGKAGLGRSMFVQKRGWGRTGQPIMVRG